MTGQPVPIPEGSVVITPAQQYAELRALTDAVKDLTGKVDPAMSGLRKDTDDNAAAIKAHDLRLDALEQSQAVERERNLPSLIEAMNGRLGKVETKIVAASAFVFAGGIGGGYGLTKLIGG